MVDDDSDVRRAVVELLASVGIEALIASSAEEALEVCERETNVDVVLADVVMPGMGGVALARHLRTYRPDLCVVLMTGSTKAVDDVIAAGAVPLLKPFSVLTLQRIIAEALDDGEG